MRYLLIVAIFAAAACGNGPSLSTAVGASCNGNADCADRCLGPNKDYPNGFCTVSCADDRDCPSDAACIEEGGGACLFTCAVDADCGFLGPGWRCVERDAHGAPGKVLVCRGG